MKTFGRTIIVLVVLNLAIGSFAFAEEKRQSFSISGSVGLPSVTMKGLPGNIVTDEQGRYSAWVGDGWSGRVTPAKEGYAFDPPSRMYDPVDRDYNSQDYGATIITFTISGTTNLPSVTMKGLPGTPVTDRDGNYSVTVNYGWSGTVTPTKEGFTFEPRSRMYSSIMADQTNQSYIVTSITGLARAVGRAGRRKVLVIPAAEVKAEDLDAITQDLHVMSHILDQKFKERRQIAGVFTDFGDFFGRDERETEAIYLQGYGVLFLMEMNIPFKPQSESREEEIRETKKRVDSVWQQAKQEVFSPVKRRSDKQPYEEGQYDAERIEELKLELIKTLKHATNIRNLKSDEWVIVTVLGSGSQPSEIFIGDDPYGGRTDRRYRSSRFRRGGSSGMSGSGGGMGMMDEMGGGYGGGMGGYGGGFGFGFGMGGFGGMGGYYSETVLTIRVKKSDVDAFAKDELDFDQFRQKVQIFLY